MRIFILVGALALAACDNKTKDPTIPEQENVVVNEPDVNKVDLNGNCPSNRTRTSAGTCVPQ